ncbi:MAG TPA: glycosyl hydrolase family 79 C-terminal domain-containing protein [Bryobacteraceae bacterium]|nr:glycosyl hydrolase family 79 C-terminal domain-containing protein [Bryobacteraceae bacterium]
MSQSVSRRSFLGSIAFGSAATALEPPAQAQAPAAGASVSISLHPDKVVATVPVNYNGLSYESAQLAHPEFFAPTNKPLIAFFRQLTKEGVLRIGGNTSEFAIWSPGGAPTGGAAESAVGPDAGGTRQQTTITPEAIRNLSGFLNATGWQLIYGLNMGHGNPGRAAEEARAVADSVGSRLIAFQIGNEPDLYHRNGLRPPDWTFDDYFSQWHEFFEAVRKAVPNASFGAPDVASNTDWIVEFAKKGADDIVLLSGHYYAEGPPTDPRMTISRLLQRDPRLLANVPRIMEASRKSHRPFRMTEGNSCYKGGKPGVSNTFASALWAADYMLFLAQSGYAGVNFHGGGNGVYTPIAGSIEAGFSSRPIYYGLLLGEQFAGSKMVETQADATGVNATAYAAKTDSGLRVAIFNKDERQPIQATLHPRMKTRNATVWRLAAPSVDSETGVRFAGGEASPEGLWSPHQEQPLTETQGQYAIDLPAASAALIFLS